MSLHIHFYLNNEEETPITSFYDMTSNPFKVGDLVHLDVDDLFPVDYNNYHEEHQQKLIQDNEELRKMFRHKKVLIVREGKFVRFRVTKQPTTTIEYHCVLIND